MTTRSAVNTPKQKSRAPKTHTFASTGTHDHHRNSLSLSKSQFYHIKISHNKNAGVIKRSRDAVHRLALRASPDLKTHHSHLALKTLTRDAPRRKLQNR